MRILPMIVTEGNEKSSDNRDFSSFPITFFHFFLESCDEFATFVF